MSTGASAVAAAAVAHLSSSMPGQVRHYYQQLGKLWYGLAAV